MPVLAATNLGLSFGTRTILNGVSLSIEPGERVGVVGRNGTGKSTLLKVLAGLMKADSGEVVVTRGKRAGYLHQDPVLDPDETLRGAAEAAFENLHRLHRDLDELFHQMEGAEGDELERLLKKQARLETEMEAAGGYAIDHKIDSVLHGLGFEDGQFGVPVRGLSGGQKGRVALARLLLEEPDVLLLDEPTNHLDIDGRLWLEQFLTEQYRGAVLLISHDRYLLDNVVNRIVEVEDGRLIDYPGNYADFREIRAMRRLTQLRAFENQQTQFKKEEAYIRRYKAGQRARQAKGRETKLERAKLETLERPSDVNVMRLRLPKAERTGELVVSARGLTQTYAREDGSRQVLFKDLDVTISRGERWGIIGPNGAGKSTLVRCLLREQAPERGTVNLGSSLKVGHYKQTHEHLDLGLTVWRYLQNVILKENPGLLLSEQQARDLGGAFLFSGSEQERELGTLSGGERSRAVLAGLLASAKNVLVLDEPTNHLDIPSAERLEEALTLPDKDAEEPPPEEDIYEGVLLLISHDRALIDATCDHLLILDGRGGVEVHHGDYTSWHEKAMARVRQEQAAASEARERREAAQRAQAAREAEEKARKARAASNPLARLSTDKLEARIATVEARIKEIDRLLGTGDVWQDARKCHDLGEERARLAAELEPLEFEYFSRGQ